MNNGYNGDDADNPTSPKRISAFVEILIHEYLPSKASWKWSATKNSATRHESAESMEGLHNGKG